MRWRAWELAPDQAAGVTGGNQSGHLAEKTIRSDKVRPPIAASS
jgi:hypothetical protein